MKKKEAAELINRVTNELLIKVFEDLDVVASLTEEEEFCIEAANEDEARVYGGKLSVFNAEEIAEVIEQELGEEFEILNIHIDAGSSFYHWRQM